MMVVTSVRSRPFSGQRGRMVVAVLLCLRVGFLAVGSAYKLGSDQLGVQPVALQQLLVAALLDSFTVVKHHNAVGVPYGGKPVRNDQSSAPLHQALQRLPQLALAHRVQMGCSLVQNQHRRVLQQGAGNGDTLPLTA